MGLLSGRPQRSLKKDIEKPKVKKQTNNLLSIIQKITNNFQQNLIRYKDDYEVLYTRSQLQSYLDETGDILAIDTETDGLSVFSKLVGVCVYAPGRKGMYIPVYHVDMIINEPIKELVHRDDLVWFIKELNKRKLIYHGSTFDLFILKMNTGVDMNYPYWDTLVGAHLTNFDKNRRGLKEQYNKYISKGEDNFSKYADLFEGLTLEKLPINLVYIYASHDSYMTFKLYEYQKELFETKFEEQKKVFEMELKLTKVISEMKIEGIQFDYNYTKKMSIALHKELDEVENELRELVSKKVGISYDMRKFEPNSNEKMKELLFKYIKLPIPKGETYSTVSVDESVLQKLKNPICDKLLEYRKLFKQISTYVDKMFKTVEKDGRIHPDFNSFGAITGRFSSSKPNFQNISNEFKSPKGNKYNIRGMFIPREKEVWIGADYSGQEIRVTAYIAKDKNMYEAFHNDRDIHSYMASLAFKTPYEDCLEFRPNDDPNGRWKKGDLNNEGKERRKKAKSVTFGLTYGTSTKGLAENLGCTLEEAQEIMDSYFQAFPTIKKAIDQAQKYAMKHGFVKTLLGRIRPIDHIHEGAVIIDVVEGEQFEFDPDLNCDDVFSEVPKEIKDKIISEYSKLSSYNQKKKYEEELLKSNIKIKNNQTFYNSALRQCFNSCVQGSSAEQTKLALVRIYEDERLRELGARIVLTIHDENIITVPKENVELACKYLEEDMLISANEVTNIVFKSDVEVYERWY